LTQGVSSMANLVKETLKKYGFKNLEQVKQVCQNANINVEEIVKGIQPIAFDDAVMAYELGCAIALQSKKTSAEETAKLIGEGLQAYCKLGSVADERQIGLGHGNLASKLLSEETDCFCFLAGHESFAAAEGAMGIVRTANKVRKKPLRVILNGLGKDAAYIISRINGFTYVETTYDYKTQKLTVNYEKPFSKTEKANVKVYGAFDVCSFVCAIRSKAYHEELSGLYCVDSLCLLFASSLYA